MHIRSIEDHLDLEEDRYGVMNSEYQYERLIAKSEGSEEVEGTFKCGASVDGLMQMSEAILDVICEDETNPNYESEP